MNDKIIEISIVSPMHNEELCVEEFVKRIDTVLQKLTDSYEILTVNDGSQDQTEQILEKLTDSYPNLKIVCLARNSGQWAATFAGIQKSKGKYIVVMDSDLQHSPEDIPLFINKIKQGYELVSGKRKKRKESLFFRRIPSFIANYFLRKITTCPVRDMGGFKCFDGELGRQLRIKAGQHRFLPALIWLKGGRVAEVDISAPKRFAGKSHYGISRTFDVFFDIILFWLQHSFKSRPIYLFGHISFLIFIISFGIMVWIIYEKFWLSIAMGTRPPFFIAISGFFLSLAFLSIGFILELISDIETSVNQTKPYFIRKIIEKSK